MIKEFSELIRYALSSDNPVTSVGSLFFIAFLVFSITRRYFSTDYIKENKESREEIKESREHLKQLNETINKDYLRVLKKNEELEKKFEELKYKYDVLKIKSLTE